MIVAHALRVNHQVRNQLAEKIAPRCFGKLRLEQEFFELANHGRLAYDRRIQPADYLEQECVGLLTTKDFNRWRREITACYGLNELAIVICVEKEDPAQAGLPFETVDYRGRLVPRLTPKIHDDQLVNHAAYSRKYGILIVI